jgi:Bacterial archaeo-eukaryotic release factor family 11
MATLYQLPTLDDLTRLAEPHELAITIYVATSPIVSERTTSQVTAKSSFDACIEKVREAGLKHSIETALRRQWESVVNDDLWSRLASSLAIFVSEESAEVFVLPNDLTNQHQVARYFDLGQLVRAVTAPQQAYALTLSSNGWKLWHATATTRAAGLELAGSYPIDAADATHRESVRGPQPSNRSTGDEARKQLLETYAKRVADAVDRELGRLDPKGEAPLFLFATDPLLDLYRSAEKRRKIIHVPGGPDDLKDFQIDEKIRDRLTGLNAGRTSARLEKIGNDLSAGLVLTDVSDIGRAAAAGAVDVLVYDFVVDILGRIDNTSGEVTYAGGDTSDAYDLLSRIGMLVLAGGGEVIAVRRDEVSADVWNGTAVAHLRYPLAG